MAAANLDFLVKVDISGVQPAGTIKNLTTVLVAFPSTSSDPIVVHTFESIEDIDASIDFVQTEKDVLHAAIIQQGVSRIKGVHVPVGTTLSDILEVDDGWFALAGSDALGNTALLNSMLGGDRLIAIGDVSADNDYPEYGNVFIFAGETVDQSASIAAAAMAKLLAFDPDRTAAQMDWQTLAGITPHQMTNAERDDYLDASINVYGVHQGLPILADGVNSQGIPYNAVIARYWLEARMREAISATQFRLVNQYGMNPFDNGGIGGMVGVCNSVLALGETIGHFVDGFGQVTAPTLADVSETDLRNGLLKINVEAVQRWRLRAYDIRGVILPTVGGVQ